MTQTVLVADSDRTTLELVTAVLTRDGFEVMATPDGGDALARFFEASPFLVVCAEALPSISGSELCRQIKAQSAETRVVLLHGAGGVDGLGLAGEIGCDAVLPLPFKYGELKKLLVKWQAVSGEADPSDDSAAFTVPTSEHFKLEMPPPVALPPDLGSAPTLAPTLAPASDREVGIPPLPVPIPLPMAGAEQPQEELPEMDLGEISGEIPEMELEEVLEEEPAAPRATQPAPDVAPPSAAPQLDIPLEGDLATVPFPRLVYRLYLATFSGIVHLASTAANRSVFIWGGIPVRVDSNQLGESLGRMLLEHGRITVEQYTESMNLMKQKGCRHGEALISTGAISEADLLDALREQTELKLANTFSWRDAAYRIEPSTNFARDSVLSEVHPLRVIWRGVHEHYDLDSLLEYFIPLQRRYVVGTDLFPVYYGTLGSHLREVDMVAHLTGDKTVDQVLQGDARTLLVAQALYVLLVTDMARAEMAPGAAVASPSAQVGVTAGEPADADTIARLSDDIASEYLRVKESDYLDALRVDMAASAEDVDAAYTNIVSALRLESMPAGMPADVLRRAREIRDILAQARAIVRDPSRRDQYLLAQQQRFVGDAPAGAAEEEDIPIPQEPQSLELEGPVGGAFEAQKVYAEGQSLMARSKFNEAAQKFREAIEMASGEPAFRVALGKALWEAEGSGGEAARMRVVTCLQQALQLDPAHVEANLEMARLLIETDNKDRAYAYVQRVLQKHSSHSEARRLLASLA